MHNLIFSQGNLVFDREHKWMSNIFVFWTWFHQILVYFSKPVHFFVLLLLNLYLSIGFITAHQNLGSNSFTLSKSANIICENQFFLIVIKIFFSVWYMDLFCFKTVFIRNSIGKYFQKWDAFIKRFAKIHSFLVVMNNFQWFMIIFITHWVIHSMLKILIYLQIHGKNAFIFEMIKKISMKIQMCWVFYLKTRKFGL